MNRLEKLRSCLFLYVKEIIERKKRNSFMESFLYVLSLFYTGVIFLKNLIYDLRILKSEKVKPIVVGIGNIDCGGTGKTPFTIFLANRLSDKKVAIVTRGYKSKHENKFLYIDENSSFDADEIGDEALLYKNHVKNVGIFIGKDKVQSAKKAGDLNYEIVLVDDGFQCRKLKKDLEIVMLNPKTLLSKSRCLPIGFLREPPKSLKRADFIVINNLDAEDKILEGEIRKYANAPIVYTRPCPKRFFDFSKKEVKIEKKTKVAAFCGIANPIFFFSSVEETGLEIVNKLELLDHEPISLKKLEDFIKKSLEKKAEFVITTEKDFVKLNRDAKPKIPVVCLEIELNIIFNNGNSKTIVEKIKKLSDN